MKYIITVCTIVVWCDAEQGHLGNSLHSYPYIYSYPFLCRVTWFIYYSKTIHLWQIQDPLFFSFYVYTSTILPPPKFCIPSYTPHYFFVFEQKKLHKLLVMGRGYILYIHFPASGQDLTIT